MNTIQNGKGKRPEKGRDLKKWYENFPASMGPKKDINNGRCIDRDGEVDNRNCSCSCHSIPGTKHILPCC